jgi:hypothetical protein
LEDEGIINAAYQEERELKKSQPNNRTDWVDEPLGIRPKSEDWKDVAFCDEFHLGLGPQVTKVY